jgi:hypothetical protein
MFRRMAKLADGKEDDPRDGWPPDNMHVHTYGHLMRRQVVAHILLRERRRAVGARANARATIPGGAIGLSGSHDGDGSVQARTQFLVCLRLGAGVQYSSTPNKTVA